MTVMRALEFISNIESKPLFKYLKAEYADAMMKLGAIRIGTLYHYRALEGTDRERGDSGEGTKELHTDRGQFYNRPSDVPPFVRPLIHVEEGAHVMVKGEVNVRYTTDAYVYSMTEEFNEDVMNDFGGACIQIVDHAGYFKEVCEALGKLALNGNHIISSGILGRCVYDIERRQHYQKAIPIEPALIKPPGFAHQKEVRAIWRNTRKALLPIDIEIISVIKFITRIR